MGGLQRLAGLLLPEGLLLAAAVVYVRWGNTSPSFKIAVQTLPYVALLLGIFLSARFGRTRLLFGLLVLASALYAIMAGASSDGAAADLTIPLVALLLPVNLAALAALQERGLFTRTGVMRLGALGAQLALVPLLLASGRDDARRVLMLTPLPEQLLTPSRIGQLATLAFAAAAVFLIARWLLTRDPFSRALAWALAASYLAFDASTPVEAATIELSAAGLMLAIGTLEGAHAMAFRDELTGLPARRALNELLARLEGAYTVAMVDVDHFKQFNDRHGHEVGDQVLRMVASRLARVGGGGRAFRYGGEEFTIVFPGRSVEASLGALEAVRTDIESAAFTVRRPTRQRRASRRSRAAAGGQRLSVTVSIGVAQWTPARMDAEQVVAAADRALYRAKDGGRNRVEC